MAKRSFARRMKRSIAKRLSRFLTKYGRVTPGQEMLTVEEAAALFMEFDKRLAALEARLVDKR